MKIMAPAPEDRQDPAFGGDCGGEDWDFSALDAGETFGDFLGMSQLPKDSSRCTFWCAIAVGALAKGSPVESVSGSRLAFSARNSLRYGRQENIIGVLSFLRVRLVVIDLRTARAWPPLACLITVL